MEWRWYIDSLSVNEGSVPALEIFKHCRSAADRDARMAPGHRRMIDVDAGVCIPSKEVFAHIQNRLVSASRHAMAREVMAGRRRLRPDALNACDEPVALSDDGFYEPGLLGIVAKRVPDFANGRVDGGVVLNEHIRTPERRLDLSPPHKRGRPLDQQDQHLHWDLFELDAFTGLP